ncbi:MAG TPA: CNNM domain-containing protein [Verrucomicrobiae bacterium]|nr:CNNM domain-containing protein [Verrucomicrobiae bacterium]
MNHLLLVIFLGCVGLSFLLSGMESGVLALSRLRIRHLMHSGNMRAAALHGYLENPENFLWTILVGNTLANLGAVSIGVMWLYGSLFPWPWLLIPVLSLGVLVFYAVCELLPKMMFRLYPNRLCLALALPFRLVHVGLRPLVAPVAVLARWLLRWSGGRRFTGHLFGTREELRQVMQESAQGLSSDERTMINRVLDLQNLTVRQVTIPLSAAETIAASSTVQEVFALARTHGFSRLPVYREEGGRRRIIGLLDLRSLLFQAQLDETRSAQDFVKPALYLDEETRFEVALRQMQRTGQRLAIVLAPDRQEVGIVALQDILRVIFGEVKL